MKLLKHESDEIPKSSFYLKFDVGEPTHIT